MPRDSAGNYTLPPGNPVVTGEVISTGWANPTMSDIGAELTNSLDRQGRGGMLAPFKFVDGTNGAPGMTWTNEPTTGFYRAGASDMRATVAGVARMRWTGSGVDVYDTVAGTWVALANASGVNFASLNTPNKFTQDQTIVKTSGVWAIWKDATPSLAGRFSFNLDGTDMLGLGYYDNNVSSWRPKFVANNATSGYFNDTHEFKNGGQTTQLARITPTVVTFGSANYSAATNPAPTLGMGASVTGAGNVENGVYVADNFANVRGGFVATADGATSGEIGINYTYSNAVSGFYFKRVGANIFRYNETGIALYGGLELRHWGADGTTAMVQKVDSGGAAFWNTAQVTSYQWYMDGGLKMKLLPTYLGLPTGISLYVGNNTPNGTLHVDVGGGGAVSNDILVTRTGAGVDIVGQNSWVQLFNAADSQGGGAGLQLDTKGGFRFYSYANGGWNAAAQLRYAQMLLEVDNGNAFAMRTGVAGGAIAFIGDASTVNRGMYLGAVDNNGSFTTYVALGDVTGGAVQVLGGRTLSIYNAAGTGYGGFFLSGAGLRYNDSGVQRGGVLWHNDPALGYGGVFVSTAAAPASGGTPGQIWLQTET